MASVKRVIGENGKASWYAFFRVAQGVDSQGKVKWKLIKKVTGKCNHDDAMEEAVRLQRLARAKAGGGDDKSQQYLHILQRAIDTANKGKMNLKVAIDYLGELTEAATGRPLVAYTIEGWFRHWLKLKEGAEKSKATIVRYTGVVNDFLQFLAKERRSAPLGSLNTEDILAFQQRNEAAGRSAVTTNLATKTLSMALKRAQELGHLNINPAKGFEKKKNDPTSKDVFTTDQVKALLATAQGEWRGAIFFAYYTGLRLKDITNLQWAGIDAKAEWVKAHTMKTDSDVEIPIHPALRAHIQTLKRQGSDEYIFPDLQRRSTGGRSGLSSTFSKIMEQAGISGTYVPATGKEGRSRNTLSFHSLRHSFVSAMSNAGVSSETRQKLTGHLDAKTHSKYTHPQKLELIKAVNYVPDVLA